jgi:hypothetical protein
MCLGRRSGAEFETQTAQCDNAGLFCGEMPTPKPLRTTLLSVERVPAITGLLGSYQFSISSSGQSIVSDLFTDKPAKPGQLYVPPGMPPLDLSRRSTSFFKFLPVCLMYLPVVVQWLLLSIRHRGLALPLIANPAIPLSGMVGVAKSAVFDVAGEDARRWDTTLAPAPGNR